MDASTNLANTGGLIHHQHVAAVSRPKVSIGPKPKVAPSKDAAPQTIKLNKNGSLVESIEIRCSCGEVILIQCEYS